MAEPNGPEAPGPELFVEPWKVVSADACHFYHTMDIPGQGTVKGHVDLRANAAAYLGHCDFARRRVLEIGPASGFLTFFIEEQGAREVVALEVSEDRIWDIVPRPDQDMAALQADRRNHMTLIKNGFWLAHGALGSTAKVVYGDATQIPQELGLFDIAVLGGILLHCRDPLACLEACSRMTTEAIIITEQAMPWLEAHAELPLKWLAPSPENKVWDVWWRFTPAFFRNILPLYGFAEIRIVRHQQISLEKSYPHFTVVGRRTGSRAERAV